MIKSFSYYYDSKKKFQMYLHIIISFFNPLTYLLPTYLYYILIETSLFQRSKECESEKKTVVVCNTNGFFHPQTVLVSAKFENMSFTKSSPTSDSRSFEHFFLSLVVHSSRQNRQTLSQQMR